eukprot:TRINITY_DN14201_c0_g1_i1.p1 TRINITY_DN14201_c0_g1~~TRINITY_DN14201_c0_g1_i1.p1  ORF type:complete len:148 (+),score=24.46 TRINITY_DN14201_c0_g1_i1:39-446(+)
MGDVENTAGGIVVTTLEEGDGKIIPKPGDELAMHYKGTLVADGSKFDSSYDRGRPFVFNIGLGQVIRGWDDAVLKMSLGEKAEFVVPAVYAYGSKGVPGLIPAHADLHFEVELLAVNQYRAGSFPDQTWRFCNLL